MEEIRERHDTVQQLEVSLQRLQNIFVEMAVLANSHGERLDTIEHQVRPPAALVSSAITPHPRGAPSPPGAPHPFDPVRKDPVSSRQRNAKLSCLKPIDQTYSRMRSWCSGTMMAAVVRLLLNASCSAKR